MIWCGGGIAAAVAENGRSKYPDTVAAQPTYPTYATCPTCATCPTFHTWPHLPHPLAPLMTAAPQTYV